MSATLLRFRREHQRKAVGLAGIGGAGCLGLGDIARVDGHNADAEAVRGDHDPVRLIL